MGTNYYWHPKGYCDACERPKGDGVHIGKSSAGWVFALHVYPSPIYSDDVPDDVRIGSLDDWRALFGKPGGVIVNEYGDLVTADAMVKTITERTWPGAPDMDPFVQSGPNGLRRSTIDGFHTIGHGGGTWDLCVGEFS